MRRRKDKLLEAYTQLCEELSAALYDEDPSGMGSTAGAPRDEYDGEAARIVVSLRGARSKEEIASHLQKSFGNCSPSLVDRVERALAKFRIRVDTAVRAGE